MSKIIAQLTISDIVYSIFVYKSAHNVWCDEIMMVKTCAMEEEKKVFETQQSKSTWMNDGQEYFKELCWKIKSIKKNYKL